MHRPRNINPEPEENNVKRFVYLICAVAIACLMAVSIAGCSGTGGNQNATVTANDFVTQSKLVLEDLKAVHEVGTKAVGTAFQQGQISEAKLHDIVEGLEAFDKAWLAASHALLDYRVSLDSGNTPGRAAFDTAWSALLDNKHVLADLIEGVPELASIGALLR